MFGGGDVALAVVVLGFLSARVALSVARANRACAVIYDAELDPPRLYRSRPVERGVIIVLRPGHEPFVYESAAEAEGLAELLQSARSG